MTGPVNIYRLSRIRGREAFNIIERHSTHYLEPKRTQEHEMESLRLLADEFMRNGVTVSEMDGFFYSFHIPHIGKEFDLIKFTAKACLNIELKSSPVSKEQIADQLRKNRSRLHQEVNPDAFERAKRDSYGARLRGLEDFDSVCVSLATGQFEGYCPFDAPGLLDQVTRQECEAFVRENLQPERFALSIIEGKKAEA